jgi:transcriptional regulator with XRE-family HTH domain
MDLKARVGKRVRELREQGRLSQEELARAARMHRVYLGELERGQKGAGLDTLEKLADALKVEPKELLTFGGRSKRRNPSLAERLAQRVLAVSQAAPASELKRFETLAKDFFAPYRPKRTRKGR